MPDVLHTNAEASSTDPSQSGGVQGHASCPNHLAELFPIILLGGKQSMIVTKGGFLCRMCK